MSAHEQVAERTRVLEDAVYSLLEACDQYRSTVDRLRGEAESVAAPNDQLLHRLSQLSARASVIVRVVEDDVLTELVPMLDRLFAVAKAERGEDI